MTDFQSALYACSAKHWNHVADGLVSRVPETALITPFALSPEAAQIIGRSTVLPRSVRKLLLRRVNSSGVANAGGLGAGQFVLPMFVHLGLKVPMAIRRQAMTAQASRVARVAESLKGRSVVQFTDGFGHRIRRDRTPEATIICERRNLHQDIFTQTFETFGNFPHQHLDRDPIESFLLAEYRLADKILVYSSYARQTFLDRGFDPARVVVAPLPVSLSATAGSMKPPERDKRRMLFVGRCEVVKGVDLAVAAARLAGVRITVAGPASPSVREWLSAQRHVDYVGLQTSEQLTSLFRSAGALILPSYESFGLVAFEAAHYGLPVIAADTTGASEYLDLDAVGTQVRGRSVDTWASAIDRLQTSGREWTMLSQRGAEKARMLSPQECTRRWANAVFGEGEN